MVRKTWKRRLGVVSFLIVLLLTACGGDIEVSVDFFRGQQWKAVMEVSLSPDALLMAGGATEIEEQLSEYVDEANAEGVDMSWEKDRVDDSLVYELTMSGEGLDSLNEVVFAGDATIRSVIEDGRDAVYFSYRTSSGMGLNSHTVRLRGGEIISGNGRAVDDDTMEWVDHYGLVEATLTERSRFNLGSVLLVLVVLAGLVGLAFGAVQLWKRRKSSTKAPCPWCGFWIPEGARHCPGCGRPR